MNLTAQAQALASNRDIEGLERLVDRAAEARVHNIPDMPRTSEILVAERLLDKLKKEQAA